ncbi:MAG: hypothetical protein R6U98_26720 [Pirellulaceae bacterium]
MTETQSNAALFDSGELAGNENHYTRTTINRALSYVDDADMRVVFQWHEPLFRFAIDDILSLRYVAVQLRLSGAARQAEVSRAFGHSVATQRRWENAYLSRGLEGLENGKHSGRPPAVPRALDEMLRKWFDEGMTNRGMARRLRISEVAVCRALKRLGLTRRKRESAGLLWPGDSPDLSETQGEHEERAVECGPQALPEESVQGCLEDAADEARSSDTPLDRQAASDFSTETMECRSLSVVAEEECSAKGDKQSEHFGGVGVEGHVRGKEAVRPAGDLDGAHGETPSFGESLSDVLASLAEQGVTLDRDPDDRFGDRALARLGQLDDAVPLFGNRPCLRQAGVLLAIPLLVESGLLEVFSEVYRHLGAAFYGLRTTVLVLFLSALLRIKRPEQFKEFNPRELGHIIGLDRMPEVKTVRRKLTLMALRKRGKEVMHAMAQRRIKEDPDCVAFLYVDGHVRPYHGQHPLAKTKKSQDQVAKPAATDNWVHDAHGEPLLVVPSEMNEGLTQVLEPVLRDVKGLIGERRVTVIFDRGGFSAKLFARLDKQGFDVMTYRKGKVRRWPASHFREQEGVVDGRAYRRCIAERKRVKVGRLRPKRKKGFSRLGPQFLWMREVRVLRRDGRQTSILTTRQDLDGLEVSYRQFNRWRQENFFKYMDAEYELDALVEYAAENVSAGTDRPNPARRPLERALAAARHQVQRLKAELGALVEKGTSSGPRTMRGFKVAHAKLRSELAEAEVEVSRLKSELSALPKRVPADDLKTLTTEKKLIVDTIKMSAYRVESRLLGMIREDYCRSEDEGRTLLQAAFQSTARIAVREEELYVELAPQSSPHRTEVVRALCGKLNELGAKFPGTRLRLNLAVQAHEPLTAG